MQLCLNHAIMTEPIQESNFNGLHTHADSCKYNTSTTMSSPLQIAAVYDAEEEAAPGDYQGMSSHFASCLHRANADQPIYLFLDAVDQLSPEDGASGMSWLPLTLPSHVKLVLSTSSEIEYRCFPVLQSLLAKHAENLVQVQPCRYIHHTFNTKQHTCMQFNGAIMLLCNANQCTICDA